MASQSARAIHVTAGAAVTRSTFIELQTDGKFDPAGVAGNADGVALEDGVDTDRIPMAVPDSGIIQVTASAAISVGDEIGCAAAGEARTAVASDPIMGKAITAAGAQGELIDLLFSKAANTA